MKKITTYSHSFIDTLLDRYIYYVVVKKSQKQENADPNITLQKGLKTGLESC